MEQKNGENFHQTALETSLFKGRPDLYFCFIKSEKLALALSKIFSSQIHSRGDVFERLLSDSALLPSAIVCYASGSVSLPQVLAAILTIRGLTELAVAQGLLSESNGQIVAGEYEQVARKMHML